MYKDITAIILAGGKSKRMGQDKAFLKLGEETIIDHIYDVMKSIFKNVFIITNEPEKYLKLNANIFEDIYKGKGPVSGIHSGLTHSLTENNFIISCDSPFITKDIIDFIINYPSEKDIIVPKADGFIQQLCGVYKKNVLADIEQIISQSNAEENRNYIQKKRKCKVLTLIERCNSTIIPIEKEFPNYKENTFFNMNNLGDYEKVLSSIKDN